MTGATQDAGL